MYCNTLVSTMRTLEIKAMKLGVNNTQISTLIMLEVFIFFTPPNLNLINLQYPRYLHVFTSGVENSVNHDQKPADLDLNCCQNRNGYRLDVYHGKD